MLPHRNNLAMRLFERHHHYRQARLLVMLCLATALAVAATADNGITQLHYQTLLDSAGDYVDADLPAGWTIIQGDVPAPKPVAASEEYWHMDTAAEPPAIVLTPQTIQLTLLSPPLTLDADCIALSGALTGTGPNEAVATLHWFEPEADTSFQTTTFDEPPMSSAEQRRFNLAEVERPSEAATVQIALTVHPEEGADFRVQNIRLAGTYSIVPEADLFYNRIGYEQVEPKFFTAWANYRTEEASFFITDAFGDRIYEGELSSPSRVQGADSVEWDGFFYRGNFSYIQEEGYYTLTVKFDRLEPLTAPIHIGFNLLWEEAFAPALAPFKRFRIASPQEGYLQLWDPAFGGGASDDTLLWKIVKSWSILKGRMGDTPAFAPLHEEALFALERLARWITDNPDEAQMDEEQTALYTAILAVGARFLPEADTIREAATQLTDQMLEENRRGPEFFSAAMDMYAATGEDRYMAYAHQNFPGISLACIEALLDYEGLTGTAVTVALRQLFGRKGEVFINNADNPFGLAFATGERRGFFVHPPDAPNPLQGASARVLAAMQTIAEAHRYAASPDFRTFVYDQINWMLGNNPFGACLVAGLCDPTMPRVALPNGMTPEDAYGAVLHGIGPRAVDDDRPEFDISKTGEINENTNGFSLYNNARYISAMAYLKRVPVGRPRTGAQ